MTTSRDLATERVDGAGAGVEEEDSGGGKSWLVISDVKGKKGQEREREREIGGREEVS